MQKIIEREEQRKDKEARREGERKKRGEGKEGEEVPVQELLYLH